MTPPTTQAQERLIEEHLPLVRHVVAQLSARYPRHVDREELEAAGAAGLVDAARRYDPATEVPFARYASIRIRGAVIDATRTTDWAPRRVRRSARQVEETARLLEQELGRSVTDHEIADHLGTGVDDVLTARAAATTGSVLALDRPSIGDDGDSIGERIRETHVDWQPDTSLERRELIGAVRLALSRLEPQQREVIERHQFGGELLRDIADDLGVTEARVSQIRQEGIHALQAYLGSVYSDVPEVPSGAAGVRRRTAFVASLASQASWRDRVEAGRADEHVPAAVATA